jgi:hypothetical protein
LVFSIYNKKVENFEDGKYEGRKFEKLQKLNYPIPPHPQVYIFVLGFQNSKI